MKDFDRLIVRFKQFGGLRLVWEYAKLGLLWTIVKEFVKCVINRSSFKTIYPAILRRVEPVLVKRYCTNLEPRMKCCGPNQGQVRIWWCWLQGVENAPALAKCCLKSLERLDTEIVVVDEKNCTSWVELPEHIVYKYKAGKIPSALFSDILRLALLIEYGGVWIDSTVLCTGEGAGSFHPDWETICSADLFVFQYTKPGERWSGSIGNWFISSKPNNPMLRDLYDALCRYWTDNDVTLDYYIFHLFFAELAKQYPDMITKMPFGWGSPCLQLRNSLGKKYDDKAWMSFSSRHYWHKMGFRLKKIVLDDESNYYNHILKEYN